MLVEQSFSTHPKVGVKVSRPRKQNVAIVDCVFLWDFIAEIARRIGHDACFQFLANCLKLNVTEASPEEGSLPHIVGNRNYLGYRNGKRCT